MKIKTYTAPSMSDVMAMIREELGDEAVIISSFEEDGEVRVTAALDDQPYQISVREGPHQFEICRQIEHHGIQENLSQRLLEGLDLKQKNIEDIFAKAISEQFLFAGNIQFDARAAPMVLIGPPGAGKTVTIAKLARLASFENVPVHVITTDVYKAGAIEQMTSFARALSMTLTTAATTSELVKEIERAPRGSFLLIDTLGCNPFRDDSLKALTETILAIRVAPTLVIPGGADYTEQLDLIEAFSAIGATKVIMTRLDLVKRIGGTLSAIVSQKMKLVGYSESPLVADGLTLLNAHELARLILGTHGTSEENDDLARVSLGRNK